MAYAASGSISEPMMAEPPKYRPINDDRTTIVMSSTSQAAASPVEHVHYLVVAEGPEHGRIVEVGHQPLTIGRASPADVVLQDIELSRAHCRVQLQDNGIVVQDLGSTNGTFVGGQRLTGPAQLQRGSTVRVGRHVLKYERGTTSELLQNRDFDRSLEGASRYIRSLLPPFINEGPIQTEWLLLPSKRLGGDAFGYHHIEERGFCLYLLDVSGHGVQAAMLAVAALNALRPNAMPDTDFAQPGHVLGRLNATFQMEGQDSLYFTIWYGYFDIAERVLHYASGGHHAAYLVPEKTREPMPLWTRNLPIGVRADHAFVTGNVNVPPDSRLYLFSDGVFEFDTAEGGRWDIDDFVPLLSRRDMLGMAEPQRLYQDIQRVAKRGPLEDDFSLLIAHFG
jgi:serine phosphatase RsbU (regulator of sigma subunit)